MGYPCPASTTASQTACQPLMNDSWSSYQALTVGAITYMIICQLTMVAVAYYLVTVVSDIQSLDLEQSKTVADMRNSDTRHGYNEKTVRDKNKNKRQQPARRPQQQPAKKPRETTAQAQVQTRLPVRSKQEILKAGLPVKLAKKRRQAGCV